MDWNWWNFIVGAAAGWLFAQLFDAVERWTKAGGA
jgi:hypothetical protein